MDNFGNTVEQYGYDALDRMQGVTAYGNGFSYSYDSAGNVTQRTYPGNIVATYSYDDDERMQSVTSSGATTNYGYDAAGNLNSTTLPAANGYVETRFYDRAGRLTEVKAQKGTSLLADVVLTLDPAGNPLAAVQTGLAPLTANYSYDQHDWLTSVCYQAAPCTSSTSPFIRWTYDAVGNRLTEARPGSTTSYSYDVDDRLLSSGTTSYTYDANGNETKAGSATFSYDGLNRLLTATTGRTTTTYTYSADGRRLSASTGSNASSNTKFAWDVVGSLSQLAVEQDGNGALLRSYLYGQNRISMTSGGASYYYHYDPLGSVINVTSSAGATQWTDSYEPFGAVRTETKNSSKAPVNPMKFTGEYLDTTGLYHLRSRQYDPTTGRFLAPDPVQPSATSPYVGAYAYVSDRPTVLTDPSGLCWSGLCWAKHAATWAVHHPDVVVDAAAAGCIVVTTGACSPLVLGALATTVGTSGYKNLRGSRRNYGRFAADVALGFASFGAGKVVGDVARSAFFVTDAGDRMVLTRVTATGFLLTDLLLQGARGELGGSGLGGNDK